MHARAWLEMWLSGGRAAGSLAEFAAQLLPPLPLSLCCWLLCRDEATAGAGEPAIVATQVGGCLSS